jgi:hypothetical protein
VLSSDFFRVVLPDFKIMQFFRVFCSVFTLTDCSYHHRPVSS